MNRLTRIVAFLFFGSGVCALIYEVAWFREFRLVFGASTLANAAVLAVFIGGLGAGGLVLGKRADRAKRPLMLYAALEAGAAVLAALSPLLLWVARKAYIATGGTLVLGSIGATVVRLLLTVLVLLGPTLLMGGTLPAAARAVETDDDASRRRVGLLYGANALGALVGCFLANFVLLELFGTRTALWVTSALNLLIAALARLVAPPALPDVAATEAAASVTAVPEKVALDPEKAVTITAENANTGAVPTAAMAGTAEDANTGAATSARATAKGAKAGAATTITMKSSETKTRASGATTADGDPTPTWFVPVASGAVGFVFFLMELVWYRMLGPLLGGTVFTFGIILAVALLGIGLGGTAYALFGSNKPATLAGFAVTCLLEGILLAVPYALGDEIATIALLLRPLGAMSFVGLAAGWAMVTLVVVLPASIVAGAQFPMLIALMGRGTKEVGAQTGWVYAANTAGSILGALAGGFGLLPAVTVIGAWKLAAAMLGVVGLGAGIPTLKQWGDAPFRAMWVLCGALAIFLLIRAEGPTAVWRHSPIGVGRVGPEITSSLNTYHDWMNDERRGMKWEEDGIESTVALEGRHGWAFIVNGKSDGHVVVDAPTQIMGGLVGAVLRPVKRAMVIGLGTGSTAGWLGALPDIERVDVAELEPAILHVAEVASPVNHHVLQNPRVHINIGDARELLLTSRDRYDLIFSEPSNPYRAGVASLFTREYYEACADRLAEDGLFLQWVQGYDIDKRTLRAVYATLGSVFPEIETWELAMNDLLLVASKQPIRHDVAAVREKLAREPLRSALLGPWRAIDAEGFYSHYLANAAFGRSIAEANLDSISTDDKNLIEFGFARTANSMRSNDADELATTARARGQHLPPGAEKGLDRERVEDGWLTFQTSSNSPVSLNPHMTEGQRHRAAALSEFLQGFPQVVVGHWKGQKREPIDPTELAVIGESLADTADEAALVLIDRLRPLKSAEAAAILGRLRLRQNRLQEAATAFEAAFVAYRSDPWTWSFIMNLAIEGAKELAAKDSSKIPLIKEALSRPFAVAMFDDTRRATLLALDMVPKLESGCVEILRPYEPYVPWREDVLSWRSRCYALAHDPKQERANLELDEFHKNTPMPFGKGLDFVRASP